MVEPGKRLTVYSIRETARFGTIWIKSGMAFVGRDGSLNVRLDVLPLDGKLHIREEGVSQRVGPKEQGLTEQKQQQSTVNAAQTNLATVPVEGHS